MGLTGLILWIGLIATTSASPSGLTGLRWLFPEARTYVLDLKTNIMTGSLLPAQGASYRTTHARLSVDVLNDTSAVFKLDNIKTSLYNSKTSSEATNTENELPAEAESLTVPWEAHYMQESGMLYEIRMADEEPLWSGNMKRALAISLQLVRVNTTASIYKNSYSVVEPCLHDTCAVEYSGVGGDTVRKVHGVPSSVRGFGRTVWFSVRPDVCNKDMKQPFIGSAERLYRLDDRGLVSLDLDSSLEYHSHGHLLTVITSMSLYRDQISALEHRDVPELVSAYPAYFVHSYKDRTNGRAPATQQDLQQRTRDLLTKVSEGIDNANVTRDADRIHDTNLIALHDIMSQLTLKSLKVLNNELHVGTSYLNETNKNIFLEVLPHIKSAASAKLVKFLVMDFTEFKVEEATALSLIRKLPFNIKEYSQELLVHMEDMLNLPPDASKEIRHASILSFATLAFNTYISAACSTDEFEGYVQKYFRMYTECPKYEDRLVWLQGLANLQVGSVSSYLGPIIQDRNVSRHERFLAIWASMPVAQFTPEMTSSLYWPILTDPSEHLQLRVAALLMLLHGDQSPGRVLSLDRYVTSSGDGHLANFWYTTVRNLRKSSYSCFSTMSKLLSYVSGLVQEPDSKYWATANRVADVSDHERQYSAMSQLVTISKPLAGHPEFFYLSLNSNQAGLTTSQISIMLKAEGVETSLINKILFASANISYQRVLDDLRKMKVTFKKQEPIHIELIINVQGKTVYALHLNQSFENLTKWDSPAVRTIVEILNSESHINQQFAQYPLQTEVELPTELGTPVTLQTTWSSFVSVRGTMTSPSNNVDWIRKNDIHLRYHGTAVTTLSSYDPITCSGHAVSIQQSTLAHAPLKFNLRLSPPNGAATFTWLNEDPTGGVVVHSRTQVTASVASAAGCAGCFSEYTVKALETSASGKESDLLFDCERPLTTVELLEKLLDSNRANYNFFSVPRPSLLMVHLLYLLSVPTPGSCGLMLESRFPGHIAPGTRLDLVLQLVWDGGDERAADTQLAFVLNWRDNAEDIEEISSNADESPQKERLNIVGLIKTDSNDSGEYLDIRIVASEKYNNESKGWQFCLKYNQTNDLSDDRDMTSQPVPYKGTVDMSFNRNATDWCHGGLELRTEYSGRTEFNGKEVTRFLDVSLYGTNEPLTSGFRLPLILTSGIFSEDDAVGKELVNRNMSLMDKNGQTAISINDWSWRFSLGDLAEELDTFTDRQTFKKYGLYQECRIEERTVETLNGSVYELQDSEHSRGLILAQCTEKPGFAVYQRSDGAYEFSAGGATLSVSQAGGPTLRVDGQTAKFPYRDINFKVEKRRSGVIIEFKKAYLVVYYKPSQVVLLVPDWLTDFLCGVCVGDHYHMAT